MAQNGTLIINGEGDQAVFQYAHTTAASGEHQVTLSTKNKFIDKDIEIDITTPAAGAVSLDVTDSSADLDMGEAVDGYYQPTATINGNASVESAGWLDTGDNAVSESGVKVGKVAQSTLKNGATAIESGAEIIPEVSDDQTINIGEGYNAARTVVVKAMEDGQAATVSSANATVDEVTFTADDANHTFDIAGTKAIDAPSVNTPGFISTEKGTKNGGTATVDATVDQVKVGVDVSGTAKVKPEIERTAKPGDETWVDAAAGAATTTKPSAGAYIQVDAAAKSANLSISGKVTEAGYGTVDHFQAEDATSTEVGSNAADSTYIPVASGAVEAIEAEIESVSVDYDSEGGNFNVTGSANIPAPSVTTPGYVGNGVGSTTGKTGGATVDASLPKVAIAAELTGTGTKKPVIAKNAATNVAAEAATTEQPEGGYYVAVQSAANTDSVQATAKVTGAGYGTATEGQYTTQSSDSLSVGAEQSDLTFIPLPSASFANAAQDGHTYADITDSAPVLVSGDYLYIQNGYTGDAKISLAKLVPDDATISASTGAGFILSGQSAYDNNGALVVGTIPTYDGSYSAN